MNRISLIKPKLKDLWFRQKCMNDQETMSYNAGYDVNYEGYHYDTGCIDFPKEKWKDWYKQKMNNPNFYYAYILDNNLKEFVGYINFNKKENDNVASMGIVIYSKYRGKGYMKPALSKLCQQAKKEGIEILIDNVPQDREFALKVFFDLGFKIIDEYEGERFGKKEKILVIEKKL